MSMQPENSKKPRGRPFPKGYCGNRRGRKPGSKNRPKTLAAADAVTAATLARRGVRVSGIARLLSARPDVVKESLAQARQLLEAFAGQIAENWITACRVAAADGDLKPSMQLLQSVKAIEPIAQTYETPGASSKATAAVQVQFVGFTLAWLPPNTAQAIDVTTRSTGRREMSSEPRERIMETSKTT